MPSDKETLVSMGFDPTRVEWALKATGNRGLQPAMDHILENEGKPVPDPGAMSSASTSSAPDHHSGDEGEGDLEAVDAEAKSIKCSECGKIFKNTALANYHAEKSGHDQFEESTEEIKPLTEEEKKKKLEELKQKMAEKRARRAEEEAKEAKASEIIRRKTGQDLTKIKADLELKEAKKQAEAKKLEKREEARAKAAVKAQIAADRKTRAEKAELEKALRQGQAPPGPTTPVSVPKPAAAATSNAAGRDFKETRLQIRMSTGGLPYTTTLSSDAPLREVAEFLAGQNLAVDVESVTLAQHFPRKTFTQDDFSKSLKDLGLTPSAVLIATP